MPSPSQTLLDHLRRLTRPPSGDAALLSRWVRERHEDAFAALVARHGPMVFGVCRRVLGDGPDAEDAFQAVFLILARKAASLRRPEMLAGWLHGVASRLAWKARAAARRRDTHSRPLAVEPADVRPDPLDLVTVREMLALFDREIGELPEVYRLPVVLCDLEGRRQEEAAEMLGWTLGSLRGRLLRGRARLKACLVRRGLTWPVGVVLPLIPATLAASSQAAVPALTPQTIAAASRYAVRFAGCSATAEVPARAAELARDGLRVLMLGKVKIAAAILVMMSVCLAGAGLMALRMREANPVEEPRENTPPVANIAPKPAEQKPQVRLDRFGDRLPEGAVVRLGTVRFRHGDDVLSVAFSPDGKTLASGGKDSTVRLWDPASGKEFQRFKASTGPGSEDAWVRSIAFSPDGKFLAAGTDHGPGEVVIWELGTGKESWRWRDNRRSVTSIAFSPDGKTLAAAVGDSIRLWNAGTGEGLRQCKLPRDEIGSIAFAPDGKTLASTSFLDKTIRLWDPATGQELRQLMGHTNRVLAIAFSRDGKMLASGSQDETIRLWDSTTGKELRILKGKGVVLAVSSLAFFPDGKTLASGNWDSRIRLWDTSTGKELRQIQGLVGSLPSIAVSPDGKTLASVNRGRDRIVQVWDVAERKERRVAEGDQHGLWAIAFSPDGQRVATYNEEAVVRFWDVSGKELAHLFEPGVIHSPDGPPTLRKIPGNLFQFAADGKTVSISSQATLGRWDTDSGKQIQRRSYDGSYLFPTPDGKFAIGRDFRQGDLYLMDAETGKKIRPFKASKTSFAAALSADGKFLASGSPEDDGTVVIWELATGKERCRCKGASGYVYALTFSPDGRYLAGSTTTADFPLPETPIYLWDAATGREVRQFQTRGHKVHCLAYSSDGRMLASGGGDKTVRLWEAETGKERRRYQGHQGTVRSVAFSADSTRLVSASDDTTALVWDATGSTFAGKLTAKQLQAAWSDLAGDDAAKAYRAVWLLARHPKQSVPLLREHVPVARVLDAETRKQVERWLADLNSDEAAIRNRANTELEKRIVTVEAMLRNALTRRPSLEQRKRIERLLERREREQVTLGRALEALEHAAAPESRQLLETLAVGEPEAWLTREAKGALRRVQARAQRR